MAPGMIGQFNIAQGSTSQLGSSPLSNFPDVETAVPQDPYMYLLEMMHAMRVELAELRAAQATAAPGNRLAQRRFRVPPLHRQARCGSRLTPISRCLGILAGRSLSARRKTFATSTRKMSSLLASTAATRQLGVNGAPSLPPSWQGAIQGGVSCLRLSASIDVTPTRTRPRRRSWRP